MKSVLWDLALAGEYVNGYVYYQNPAQNRATINNELLNEIYRINDISKREFDKSLEYYKQHPKVLMAILDSIAVQKGGQQALPAADPALGNPVPLSGNTPPVSTSATPMNAGVNAPPKQQPVPAP